MKVRALALLCAFVGIAGWAPAQEERRLGTEIDQNAWGAIPVHYEGRVMPLSSAARQIIYRFAARGSVSGADATSWLVRVLVDPFAAVEDEALLVDDPAALDAIGYPDAARGRYSYIELYPYLEALNILAVSLSSVERDLDPTEEEIIYLANNIRLFEGLASTLDVFRGGSRPSGYAQYLTGGGVDPNELVELPGMLRLIPMDAGDRIRWLTPARGLALAADNPGTISHEAIQMLHEWGEFVAAGEGGRLPESPSVLLDTIDTLRQAGAELGRTRLEQVYFRLRPTFWAALAALIALVLHLWFAQWRHTHATVRGMLVATVILLTAHQVMRFLIMRRPPVTDLPSSFHFVAWILAITGTVLSYRQAPVARVGVLLPTLSVPVFVYFARLVTGAGDPFGIVQAVLDTNFWLTTHVLIVTAGYAGVIAAGVAGHVYLIRRIARPHRVEHHQASFRPMIVLMLVGLALTFLGTILGGVWADQSWGRFWGWDPKENGALLIILWTSIALHARLTRWLDQAGFAAASIFGINVVFFSWLGVNLMGVGLHSYGFHDASFWVLAGVVVGETAFAIIGWTMAARRRPDEGLARVTIEEVRRDGDAVEIVLSSFPHAFEPGEYVGVRPEGFAQPKPFSLVANGAATPSLLVKASGPVSDYLVNRARAGESLWVSRPAGEFHFTTQPDGSVVMLAGGVGIAPILGLINVALDHSNEVVLIRAGRDSLYASDAVHRLEVQNSHLRALSWLTRPPNGWKGRTGRVTTATLAGLDRELPARAEWYISGSPEFCDSGREIARHFGARAVFTEVFTSVIDAPKPLTARATVTVDDTEVEVLPGQSLLDAALSAGVHVRYSCLSGTCGECACHVLAGGAVQGVSPAEAGPGDRVYTCVAYPKEPEGLAIENEDDQSVRPGR